MTWRRTAPQTLSAPGWLIRRSQAQGYRYSLYRVTGGRAEWVASFESAEDAKREAHD